MASFVRLKPESVPGSFERQVANMPLFRQYMRGKGFSIQRSAQRNVHVITGRLRSSLRVRLEDGKHGMPVAVIGSDLDYAQYEEALHPYLRPALRGE